MCNDQQNIKIIFFKLAKKKMCIIIENNLIVELYSNNINNITGNIYIGEISNIVSNINYVFAKTGKYDVFIADKLKDNNNFEFNLNDKVMVQITRDPLKQKCAQATCSITIPGIYTVLTPFSKGIGVSAKIDNEREKERLKNIALTRLKEDIGIIIRTSSENVEDKYILKDIDELIKKWKDIQLRFKQRKNLGILYSASEFEYNIIKKFFNFENIEILTSIKNNYDNLIELKKAFNRDNINIKRISNKKIIDEYNILDIFNIFMSLKFPLKCGGNIIIDRCEALTVIDVNLSTFKGDGDLEKTILKVNLEAVEQIAYQIRLQDIGGIIVIDLIDMKSNENKNKIIKKFKKYLNKDRTKIKLGKITEFGLLEMTRKKVKESFYDSYTEKCSYCNGSGKMVNKKIMKYLQK